MLNKKRIKAYMVTQYQYMSVLIVCFAYCLSFTCKLYHKRSSFLSF